MHDLPQEIVCVNHTVDMEGPLFEDFINIKRYLKKTKWRHYTDQVVPDQIVLQSDGRRK